MFKAVAKVHTALIAKRNVETVVKSASAFVQMEPALLVVVMVIKETCVKHVSAL